MRKLLFAGLFFGAASLAALADPHSGPHRQTILEEPWGTVYCAEKSTVVPDSSGSRYQVKTPDGPIAVLLQNPWIHIQAPDGSLLRVRSQEVTGGTEILVQMGKVNYRIIKRYGEVEWNFPEDHIYFKTMDGNLRDVLGSKGSLSVRHSLKANLYKVESDDTASEYEVVTEKLGKGSKKRIESKLKVHSGDPASKYPYLVRGVNFQLGSVGLYLPLTTGKFTNALDWSQVQSFSSKVTAVSQINKKGATSAATPPPDDDDPMGLKLRHPPMQFKGEDPLDANTTAPTRSDDVLNVKNYDSVTPKSNP